MVRKISEFDIFIEFWPTGGTSPHLVILSRSDIFYFIGPDSAQVLSVLYETLQFLSSSAALKTFTDAHMSDKFGYRI